MCKMMNWGYRLILICFLLFYCCCCCKPALGGRGSFFSSRGDTPSPALLPFPANDKGACELLVEKHNYPCEEHKVITDDGFVLSIQRIPNPKLSDTKQPSLEGEGKPVVLLQHGVLVDGGVWLLSGPGRALGFLLADTGFDVWIVNTRGTKYSLRHTSLKPNDKDLWDWSWDSLLEHDFSATLQYVHNQTGQKVHYVGHSMGTLVALGALSTQRQMNLIRSAALLAPIGYLSNISSTLSKVAAKTFLAEASYWLGMRIYNPLGEAATKFLVKVCSVSGIDCSNLLNSLTGKNCCLNASTLARFFDQGPQPTSTKVMIHLSQNIRGGKITKYDYGSEKANEEHYGNARAPAYDMTAIPKDLPMFFASGGADALSDVKDVEQLLCNLRSHNQQKVVHVYTKDYAHADYVFADNAKEAVYDPLITFLTSN